MPDQTTPSTLSKSYASDQEIEAYRQLVGLKQNSPIPDSVKERSKLTRFQRLHLTDLLWREALSRAAFT